MCSMFCPDNIEPGSDKFRGWSTYVIGVGELTPSFFEFSFVRIYLFIFVSLKLFSANPARTTLATIKKNFVLQKMLYESWKMPVFRKTSRVVQKLS